MLTPIDGGKMAEPFGDEQRLSLRSLAVQMAANLVLNNKAESDELIETADEIYQFLLTGAVADTPEPVTEAPGVNQDQIPLSYPRDSGNVPKSNLPPDWSTLRDE